MEPTVVDQRPFSLEDAKSMIADGKSKASVCEYFDISLPTLNKRLGLVPNSRVKGNRTKKNHKNGVVGSEWQNSISLAVKQLRDSVSHYENLVKQLNKKAEILESSFSN